MNSKFKMSFCPTMAPYAEMIAKGVEGIEPYPSSSAAMVLNMLSRGMIDMALIGREAYSDEVNSNIGKKRLKDGYTLIYTEKVAIPEEKLGEIPIKTYLPKEVAEKILPEPKNIVYCQTLEGCVNPDNDLPVLIDWKDFKDEFELLIPINKEGGKTPVFRAPVIYYRKNISKEIIDKIAEVVS